MTKTTNRMRRLLGSTAVAALALALTTAAYADQASSENIETVLVTGTRSQAQDVKVQAPVLLDVAPLDQIRSLPDENAAEALQRLPGISMESDTGEGRFVNIRGMDADLNGTTYDGVRLTANNPASPQGGARAVGFDGFPPGSLGGVEVIKSLTPELDAEGLGGVVNIQPRTLPAGKDHIFDATVSYGDESLRGTPVYQGDITVGKRFADDKLSVIFSYGYRKDARGINDIEEDYAYANDGIDVPAGTSAFLGQKEFDNLQARWYQYHRTRQGFGGGVTYDINSTTSLFLRGVHAGYDEIANKHELILKNLGHNLASVSAGGSYDATQATVQYADINTREQLGNDLVEVGGHTLIADLVKLDGRLSWTQGYDHWPYSTNTKFTNPNPVDVIYNNSDPTHPTFSAVGGGSLVDPAAFTQASGSNGPSDNLDREYAGVVNASFPLEFAGDQGVLKFGGSARERSRHAQAYSDDLNITDQNLSDYVAGPDVTYYNGWYNIGPQPNYSKLLTNIAPGAKTPDLSTYEHDNENVYAGYVQYSVKFGDLEAIGGVRIEQTDGTYRANQFVTDALGNTTMSLNTEKHSYTNVFPDVSFKYNYSDALQFRLAFSTAIARPGFNQITAARSIDLYNATPRVTQGNPDLKPTTGQSVDLYASYFLPNDGILAGGVFYKAFSNYIIPQTTNSTTVAGFVGQTVNLTTFDNIGSAHAEGVEAEYSQQFTFLPGLFSGLGVEGNVTYVETSGEIRPGEKHTLPQTSPFSYNAGVFYDKGPVNLKLAASYVSANIFAVGGDATTDVYSQPRFRLDFGGSYDLTENVQVYADVKNITNTHLEFTYTKSKAFPIQNEFYDPDYLFGVRVKL